MNLTLVINDRIFPAEVPYPGCGFAQAETSCPKCSTQPVRVNGVDAVTRVEHGEVRAIRGKAVCRDCGRVIGIIRGRE